jgi:hypothetical protein
MLVLLSMGNRMQHTIKNTFKKLRFGFLLHQDKMQTNKPNNYPHEKTKKQPIGRFFCEDGQ